MGSVRPHKGVELLREAVEHAGDMRLTITDDPPPSARPNENWTGLTSLAVGLELVNRADIVAIPSLPWIYGYQLPVKLIDAMLAGRAIVASDLPPIRLGSRRHRRPRAARRPWFFDWCVAEAP